MKYIKRIAIVLLTLPETIFTLFRLFIESIVDILNGYDEIKVEIDLYPKHKLTNIIDWLFAILFVYLFGFVNGLSAIVVLNYIAGYTAHGLLYFVNWIYERFYEDR